MIPFLLSLFFLLPSIAQCMERELSCNEPIFIKKLKHKRNSLKNELEIEKEHFFMWNPIDDQFESVYKAKNSATLSKIIPLYSPSMRVKGYSGLGIITISPNISVQEKRDIIQELFTQGFTPTPKDKKLAFLELWERIPFDKIMLLLCASRKNPDSIFSTLPRDLFMFLIINLEKPFF